MIKKREPADNRKIAIYARKSKITESGKSTENQITKCRSYAELKFGARDADILVYRDEGLSGFYSDRPQYPACCGTSGRAGSGLSCVTNSTVFHGGRSIC
jgi:hypothetical protein